MAPGELLPAKALAVPSGSSSMTHGGQEPLLSEVKLFNLAEETTKVGVCVVVLFLVLNGTCHKPICVLGKKTQNKTL